MNQNEKLNAIFEAIKGQLEPGVEYYTYKTKRNGKSFYKITDGKMDDAVPECIHWKNKRENIETIGLNIDDVLREISKEYDAGAMVCFTLSKENGFAYKVADAELLIPLMKLECISEMDNGRREENFVKVIPGKDAETPELDILSKIYDADGGIRDFDITTVDKHIVCLYHALGKKLEMVYLFASETNVNIQTIPEIPGLTQLYAPVEDLTLDGSDIGKIYGFLESWSDAKVAKALEVLDANPDLKAQAEKRYLNLIKARAGENAGLESFAKAALTRKETNLLDGEHFDKNFISLSYFDQDECQLVVDFIGGLVLNHMDIDAFKTQAESAENESDLSKLYLDAAKAVKEGILEEAKKNPGGWFSKLSVKFANHKVEKVLFEKTDFTFTKSDKLKACVFYLNLNQPSGIYLDVYQSYLPELTEFFWFLPNVPKSSWGDTSLALPESTLKFKRTASYRLGDDRPWKKK